VATKSKSKRTQRKPSEKTLRQLADQLADIGGRAAINAIGAPGIAEQWGNSITLGKTMRLLAAALRREADRIERIPEDMTRPVEVSHG
jgi:hypothetical protein